MPKQQMSEFDIFYISYDEPNREHHWANLLNVAPWAKRVHGVKGFDAAHKECARLSETDKFITVDGDNIIDPAFLELELTIPELYDDCVLSWASRNDVNGLVYGNGGLKLWPKAQTLIMNTHEAATEGRLALDFCWDDKYIQMNNTYSSTYPNGSPFQAFRAGFREGCKMTFDYGNTVDPTQLESVIHEKNLKRLLIWMSVGADAKNGHWAMYGARLGLVKANLDPEFDINVIRDYDWFLQYWNTEIYPLVGGDQEQFLLGQIIALGEQIRKDTGLKLSLLSPEQSEFFKYVYEAPKRTGALRTEIEVDAGAPNAT